MGQFVIKNGILKKYISDGENEIKIPNGVAVIGKSAFEFCQDITSIEIPEGVTKIKENAFKNCENLSNIVIPKSVTRIEDSAFFNCNKLIHIDLPDNLKQICRDAFMYCSSLSSVIIPKSVTKICPSAFMFCTDLSGVTLSEGLKEIQNCAFDTCINLRSIILPKSIKRIDRNAFCDCKSLTEVIIQNTSAIIEESAFLHTPFATAETGGYEISDGILTAYSGTESIVTIPDGVREIGSNAFYGCVNVKQVIMPEGVKKIGDCAFVKCEKLLDINISKNVDIGALAFADTAFIQKFYDPSDSFAIINGFLMEYKGNSGNVIIPKGVKIINGSVFLRKDIESVVIPDGVTEIRKKLLCAVIRL